MLEELMMKNRIPSWSRLAELGWNPWVSLIYSSSECGLKCLSALLCLPFEVISAGFWMVLSPVDAFVGCQEPRGSPADADGGAWKKITLLVSWEKAFSKNLGATPRLFLSLQRFLWADSWCCQKIEDPRFHPALLKLSSLILEWLKDKLVLWRIFRLPFWHHWESSAEKNSPGRLRV